MSDLRKVAVVAARFNEAVTAPLVEGAVGVLRRRGVDDVRVVWVAGALELPVVARAAFDAGFEAVVAVGAVIRGETDHYELVSREATRGLVEVSLAAGRPVGNAVLAVHEYGQAVERALPGPGNKGAEAAEAVLAAAEAMAELAASAAS